MENAASAISEKLIPASRKLVESYVELAGKLRFDKENPQHLSSVCTYGTILEIAAGINALADVQQTTSIPILLRTLLDAYASFRCCCSDPAHAKTMGATFLKEKRRLLDSVRENPENPYLKQLAETTNVEEDIQTINMELAELKKQGHEPLKPWQEFAKAGLQAEYQSLYWTLCMQAHNNVSALEDRHLEKKDGDYEVTLFRAHEPEHVIRYLDSMCGLVVDASRKIDALLDSGLGKQVKTIAAGLHEIRELYPK